MAVVPIRSGTLGSLIVVRRRPVTTHTIEMAQIKEINAKLKPPSGVVIMARQVFPTYSGTSARLAMTRDAAFACIRLH